MATTGYLETQDGAKIYYEDHGKGRPILLVHGWMWSSRVWRKNVPALADEFRVVTIDLRGHGNSSKTLAGHSVAQYARDVRQVIEQLNLKDVVLVGWSLGGPVVLSYYRQYEKDSRLRALGLVDTAPFPFSPADWNDHPLRNYNYDGMNATFIALAADPAKFFAAFAARMFKEKPSDADAEWVIGEARKTPAWISRAIYSDYLMSDLASALPGVKIPVIVFAASPGASGTGMAKGEAVAAQLPRATFVPFDDAGHMLFYERPEKFNAALAAFIKAL